LLDDNSDIPVYNLQDLCPVVDDEQQPTLLILGSEGHGLRNLVAKSCTEFVQIPGASDDSDSGVDSLNVSVMGGILLWHLVQQQRKI
jgi:21S rRNA (GM2251-2'-O)-methyltransferase